MSAAFVPDHAAFHYKHTHLNFKKKKKFFKYVFHATPAHEAHFYVNCF